MFAIKFCRGDENSFKTPPIKRRRMARLRLCVPGLNYCRKRAFRKLQIAKVNKNRNRTSTIFLGNRVGVLFYTSLIYQKGLRPFDLVWWLLRFLQRPFKFPPFGPLPAEAGRLPCCVRGVKWKIGGEWGNISPKRRYISKGVTFDINLTYRSFGHLLVFFLKTNCRLT